MENSLSNNTLVKALPAFLAAARSESFAKASAILGMPKKTLNRYISQLEQYLDVALFIRQRNQLYLTQEGKQLFNATSSGLGHILSTLHEISPFGMREKLVIACPQELYGWLTHKLPSLQQLMQHTQIELIANESFHGFEQKKVDIVFAFGMGKWRDVESFLLFEEEIFPVCSPTFAEKHQLICHQMSPEQFVNLPLIHCHSGVGRNWQNWCVGFDLDFSDCLEPRCQTSNYLMSLEMAKQGEGIALAGSGSFKKEIYQGLLMELPSFRLKSNIGFYMILQPNSPIYDVAKKWWRIIT